MSAAAEKNLKYYLANPDEMPTDPKELERLANDEIAMALESGKEQIDVDKLVGTQDPVDDKADSSTAEVKPVETPAEAKTEAKAETPAEPAKAEGILAKDGKNVIPYSQLEAARQRALAAEQLVKEQAARLAELEGKKDPPATDVDMLSDEELDTLEQDSPTLAKTLRAQQNAIRSLNETLKTVASRQEQQAEVAQMEVKNEVQSAIDANPTLAAWQTAEDQTLWNEAIRIDRTLRESPRYATMSFADRFKKVVELTQVAFDVTPDTPAAPALTQEQIKAAAQAKLAATKPGVPRSLSDIPGGAPPAVDEKAKVEEMSVTALGSQFMNMTREQMDAYLATL